MSKFLNRKLLVLTLLAIVLIFAVKQVEWKVSERATTRNDVVRTIAEQYSREQQLTGPVLWIKCTETRTATETDNKGTLSTRSVPHDCSRLIRPSRVEGLGNLEVAERYRGIYKSRVYLAALKFKATLPAYQPQPGQRIEAAHLIFAVNDPRGLKRIQVNDSNGHTLAAKPGMPGGPFRQGFHIPVDPARLEAGLSLDAELELAGSGQFDWVPVAENNDIRLNSAWPHPSFTGRFLPETRQIGASGFSSRWRVNDFATGGDRLLEDRTNQNGVDHLTTTLGVSLIDPVDAYTQTDRAVRYGFLFVLLTIGGFFLFELLKRRPVHPLQYLLVGFAVVLFFLLLLALSEHLAFVLAYLIAAAACVLLIAAYGRTLLGDWRHASALGGGYALLYAGLYQLLTSEDYALLLGAWLIFGLLALTMWLTRKLDWNQAG